MKISAYLGMGYLNIEYIEKLLDDAESFCGHLSVFDVNQLIDIKDVTILANEIIYYILFDVKTKIVNLYRKTLKEKGEEISLNKDIDDEIDIYVDCMNSGFDTVLFDCWYDHTPEDVVAEIIKKRL